MYDDNIRISAEETQSPAMHMSGCKPKVFCNSMSATILFEWWVVSEPLGYFGSLFVLFGSAILSQFLTSLLLVQPKRKKYTLLNESERPVIQPHSQGTIILFKIFRTIVYFTQIGISFLLMLAAMSFNVGVFLAIVSGLAIGYAFFLLRLDHSEADHSLDITHHHHH